MLDGFRDFYIVKDALSRLREATKAYTIRNFKSKSLIINLIITIKRIIS